MIREHVCCNYRCRLKRDGRDWREKRDRKFEVPETSNFGLRTLTRLACLAFPARPARLMVPMHESLVLVLLCQRGEIAVDFVMVATVGPHLNRHMFDAKICAHLGADGVK